MVRFDGNAARTNDEKESMHQKIFDPRVETEVHGRKSVQITKISFGCQIYTHSIIIR